MPEKKKYNSVGTGIKYSQDTLIAGQDVVPYAKKAFEILTFFSQSKLPWGLKSQKYA